MKREPLTKLEYRMGEDGMLYPNLLLSKNPEYDRVPVGIFGRSWKEYMKEKHPIRLSELIALGKINEIITKVDQEAEEKTQSGIILPDLLAVKEYLKKQCGRRDTQS